MSAVHCRIVAAALCLAASLPAIAQQQALGPDVREQPAFKAIAERLSPAESLELAAHVSMVLRQ
jgi:hypothetical protein